jgi:uncharacterized lipoprotein YmbA
MTRMRTALISAIFAPLLLAACGSLPASHIYILTPPADASASLPVPANAPAFELLPVGIPDYLDTTDILLRNGANELVASPTAHWGERLSAGLTRALAVGLQKQLPAASVTLLPSFGQKSRRIVVTVEALDLWADGHCVLTAHWMILGDSGQSALASSRGSFTAPPQGTGDGAAVAGVSSVVAQLTDQVAATINADGIGTAR